MVVLGAAVEVPGSAGKSSLCIWNPGAFSGGFVSWGPMGKGGRVGIPAAPNIPMPSCLALPPSERIGGNSEGSNPWPAASSTGEEKGSSWDYHVIVT